MEFVKTENGAVVKFPYTFRDLRADYPNVSFPSNVNVALSAAADRGIFPVTRLADPVVDDATQKLAEGVPVDNGGTWEVQRVVVAKTAEEQQAYQEAVDFENYLQLIKSDPQISALLKASPAQADTYIDSNVTDLASARNVLKILARAIIVIGYRVIR